MIKWTYFLKYLKRSLFGFLISCFTVLGNSFVNASSYFWPIWNQWTSVVNSNYTYLINWKWNLLTTYFGVWKRLFQIQDWVYFLRYTQSVWESLPYIYVNAYYDSALHKQTQWFLKTYLLCDYIWDGSWATSFPTNCVKYSISDWNFQSWWKRIMNSLNNQGYYYYNYVWAKGSYAWGTVNFWELTLCFSSKQYYKSLCFWWGLKDMYAQDSRVSSIWRDFYRVTNNSAYCGWQCTETNLSWTLNLSPYFDSINNGVLGMPPWNYQAANDTMSWNVVTEPDLTTYWDVISDYEKYYKFDYNLCYLWTNDLSVNYSWDYVHWTWLSIFDAYTQLYQWTNVSDPYGMVANSNSQNIWAWLNTLLNKYFTYNYKRQDVEVWCTNCLLYGYWGIDWYYSVWKDYYDDPRDWLPSALQAYATYANNRYLYIDDNWQSIAEYCRAKTTLVSPNTEYDWYLSPSTIANINNHKNNLNNSTDWQNWDYQVPSWTWFMFTGSTDFWESAKNFYAQLTSKLNIDWFQVTWSLPEYILWFMVLIILFRFLKK